MSRPLRVVLTADNHLSRYYDKMSPGVLERRRQHLRRGFKQAVDYALDHEVDLFVQAGDLFDSPEPRNLEREFVAAELQRLGERGVRRVGIGGNHDTPKMIAEQGGSLPQSTFARLGGMVVFRNRTGIESISFEHDGMRVAVGGLCWNASLPNDSDPLAGLTWEEKADVKVLVFHHSIRGHIYPGANEPIVEIDTLDRFDSADYFFAGHVHKSAQRQIGRRWYMVPGATERMTFGEDEGTPGFLYLEIERGGLQDCQHKEIEAPQPRAEPLVRTPELRALDAGDWFDVICARIEEQCSTETLMRLRIQGPLDREDYSNLRLRDLHLFGSNRNFFFEIDTQGLTLESSRDEAEAMRGVRFSQQEEIRQLVEERLRQAGSDEERGLLLEARDEVLAQYP